MCQRCLLIVRQWCMVCHMNPADLADLISTTEAVEMLGVDRSTLSRYVKFGDIQPAKRFGTGPKAPMVFWKSDIERLREEKIAAGVISA